METLFGDDDQRNKNGKKVKQSQPKRIVVKSDWPAKIYAEYPRKVGVDAAIKAIDHKIRDIAVSRFNRDAGQAFAFLLERTKAFAESQKGNQDRGFIPHPQTWFNQGRFNDDPQEWNRWRGPEWYDEQKKALAAKNRAQEAAKSWPKYVESMDDQQLAQLKLMVANRIRKNYTAKEQAYLDRHGVEIPGPFDRIAKSIVGFGN